MLTLSSFENGSSSLKSVRFRLFSIASNRRLWKICDKSDVWSDVNRIHDPVLLTVISALVFPFWSLVKGFLSALTAEKALEWGVVYRVCEADKLEKTRDQVLKKLRRGSANSYAAIKKLVWESQFKDWQNYAELELKLQESLAQTEDFKEGVRAHSERRRPKFSGK